MDLKTGLLAAVTALTTCLGAAAASADTIDLAPDRVIIGSATQFDLPSGIALDGAGNIYTSNNDQHTVLVHAAGATGNAPPLRAIGGSTSGIVGAIGVAVDSTGTVYALSAASRTIRVFAPGADGNVAPTRVIDLAFYPSDIVAKAGLLFVSSWSTNAIAVFPAGAAGAATPLREIKGARTRLDRPGSLAVDDAGRIHVATAVAKSSILVYDVGANGDVSPLRAISGSATELHSVRGLALDDGGNVYASNVQPEEDPNPAMHPDDSLLVFKAGASGNVAPTRKVSGSASRLLEPGDLVVDARRNVYVVNNPYGLAPNGSFEVRSEMSVNVFGPLMPKPTPVPVAKRPSAVRSLAVAGGSAAPRRTVTWQRPSADGGAPITGYRIVVKKGSKTLLTKRSTGTSTILERKSLGNGSNVVYVSAENKVGAGPAASKTFTVRK